MALNTPESRVFTLFSSHYLRNYLFFLKYGMMATSTSLYNTANFMRPKYFVPLLMCTRAICFGGSLR